MFLVLGLLAVIAGAALLEAAIRLYRRVPVPRWAENWLVEGIFAPVIVFLISTGLVLIGKWLLIVPDKALSGEAWMLFAVELLATAYLLWRRRERHRKAPISGPTAHIH